jgi:hypothetical protein
MDGDRLSIQECVAHQRHRYQLPTCSGVEAVLHHNAERHRWPLVNLLWVDIADAILPVDGAIPTINPAASSSFIKVGPGILWAAGATQPVFPHLINDRTEEMGMQGRRRGGRRRVS